MNKLINGDVHETRRDRSSIATNDFDKKYKEIKFKQQLKSGKGKLGLSLK